MNQVMTVIMIILGGIALIGLMGYSAFMFFVQRTWLWAGATLVFIVVFYLLGKYVNKILEEGFY